MEYQSANEEGTESIAATLAQSARPGDIFCLNGPLGAGKTAFARGFIRALTGNDTDVPSPTYTLVQTYDTPRGAIWHFDLYRMVSPAEVLETGWDDALADGICLIEWPGRAGPYLPRRRTDIDITPGKDNARSIKMTTHE